MDLPTFMTTPVHLGRVATEASPSTILDKAMPGKEETYQEYLVEERSRLTVKCFAWTVSLLCFLTVCTMLTFTSKHQDTIMEEVHREKYKEIVETALNGSRECLPWMSNLEKRFYF